MRLSTFRLLLLLSFLGGRCATAAAQTILTGTVRAAEDRKPLTAAVLEIVELGVRTATTEAGDYRFRLPTATARQLTLRATYVGRQDVEVVVKLAAGPEVRRDLQLPLRSLELADVQVNATRSGQQTSNSAIVIGREAIEQTQAYSLNDVLQLLPGKVLLNTNLQGAQAITLRSAPVITNQGTDRTAAFSQNNAFGTAIIVDGAAWSNNGNLQSDDPGRRGSIGTFRVPDNSRGGNYTSGDYAGSSLDLKQIPANNIESVEVIQGVPSARYGDLSSGAVIVNRQAGRTPYRVSTRTQSGTTELTASKGIGLGGGNALNVSGTLLNSNPEPQFKTKSFNRLTLGTIYTSYFGPGRRHRNSLALDAHSTLDDARTDPDDQGTRRTSSRDQRVALSNRGTLNLLRPWSEYVSYQFGASYSHQRSYLYQFENQQVRPVSDALTTGISRGSFTPGVYEVKQRIIGRPLTLYARAENTLLWTTGTWSHTFTAGASVNYDRNLGEGRLLNPLRPISSVQANVDGKGPRPFSFRSVPGMVQAGAFLENQVVREWGSRRLVANLGVRYDNQNGFSTLAPRLNAKLFLNEAMQLNAAYGVSAKAPGLIHRYPGLLYFESPLLVSFNGREDESLYLVHTQVINPANADLRPARTRTLELGLNLRSRRGYALSVTAYRKQDEDGFSVNQRRLQLELPVYRLVSTGPGQMPGAHGPAARVRLYLRRGREQSAHQQLRSGAAGPHTQATGFANILRPEYSLYQQHLPLGRTIKLHAKRSAFGGVSRHRADCLPAGRPQRPVGSFYGQLHHPPFTAGPGSIAARAAVLGQLVEPAGAVSVRARLLPARRRVRGSVAGRATKRALPEPAQSYQPGRGAATLYLRQPTLAPGQGAGQAGPPLFLRQQLSQPAPRAIQPYHSGPNRLQPGTHLRLGTGAHVLGRLPHS
jgi:ferric enterobactin receptor